MPMSARPADTPPARSTLLKALQGSGIALRPGPDGSLQASLERLDLRNVGLQTALGSVDVVRLALTNAVLRLAASDTTFELLGFTADEVQLENAELTPAPGTAPPEDVRLEPLGTVQGRLQVSVRDAAWVIDAEITMPIVAGRIDFDRVVVEHIGPNSSMGVSRDAIYVEAPSRERMDLVRFAVPDIAGVRYEQRGLGGLRVVDRGSIDLRPFAEAVLRAGMQTPPWRPPTSEVQAMLDRTKLVGDVQLADGAIGTERDRLVLDGRAQGRNGIALTAAVLGQRLLVHWPELSASGSVFGLLGGRGTTGPITAAVDAQVTGLSGAAPQVAVTIRRLTVRNVAFGTQDQAGRS